MHPKPKSEENIKPTYEKKLRLLKYSSDSFFFYGKTVDMQCVHLQKSHIKYNTMIDDLSEIEIVLCHILVCCTYL